MEEVPPEGLDHEEMVNQALWSAYSHRHSVEHAWKYLLGCLYFMAKQHLRSRGRRIRCLPLDTIPADSAIRKLPVSEVPSDLEIEDKFLPWWEALDDLHRDVLRLRMEELTAGQIGELQGFSIRTTFRILKDLRESLEQFLREPKG